MRVWRHLHIMSTWILFFGHESTQRPQKYYGFWLTWMYVCLYVRYSWSLTRTKGSFEMVKKSRPADDKPLDLQRHVEAKIVAVVVVASEGFILVLVNHRSRGGCAGGGQLVLGLGCCSSSSSRSRITLLELCCCCWDRRWNRWLMCSWACYHWYNSRRLPVVSAF